MVGAVMDSARTVDAELWRRVLAIVLDGLAAASRSGSLPGEPVAFDALTRILGSADLRKAVRLRLRHLPTPAGIGCPGRSHRR